MNEQSSPTNAPSASDTTSGTGSHKITPASRGIDYGDVLLIVGQDTFGTAVKRLCYRFHIGHEVAERWIREARAWRRDVESGRLG